MGNPLASTTGRRERTILGLVVACLFLFCSAAADPPEQGTTHALLINGGSGPTVNYQSHLHHLEDMVELLERRGLARERIHVFSADGQDDAADLVVRDPRADEFWLIEGTRVGQRLRPRAALVDTRWEGMPLRPATAATLQKWFETTGRALAPGDRLLIFVTDHGTANDEDPDNGAISLWKEQLTVRQLEGLVSQLQPGVRTVMLMSQCFSGSFASTMYGAAGSEPSGAVCGFFSTARDLPAYGCYPEGRDRDRIGYAFHFIDALGRHETTNAAHVEVLVTDATPDAPLRTSDVYLERIVAEEAEALGLGTDVLADRLLVQAWKDRASWEPEIRLLDRIGDAFGTFSPRSLSELDAYERELPGLIERMKTYSERWDPTLTNVKQENLESFESAQPDWRERLQDDTLRLLDVGSRKELAEELLPELERHARDRPEIWHRLEELRDRAGRASAARWRLEVRRAATRRLRSILMSIAGRVLLEGEGTEADAAIAAAAVERRSARRRALEQLESCEAFEPGRLAAGELSMGRPSVEPFPTLQDDLRLMEEILPSWLGVRYGNVPEPLRVGRELPDGASVLEAIFPDSPASEAGMQVGDIVLGPPGRPFATSQQIREWTMTSSRGTPLPLRVLRPGATIASDRTFETQLLLRAFPLELPELPGPPLVGDAAPVLPASLEAIGRARLADLRGRPRLLFFWATWCEPCKRAVPEVLALARSQGLQVLAISDEEADTVADFLKAREEPFFEQVAVDAYRRSFVSYGVSGTPTILIVNEQGIVVHRQMGYNPAAGLAVEGWNWSRP